MSTAPNPAREAAIARRPIVLTMPLTAAAVELADMAIALRDKIEQFAEQFALEDVAETLEQAGHDAWAESEDGIPLAFTAGDFAPWFERFKHAQSLSVLLAETLDDAPIGHNGHLREALARMATAAAA